VVGGEQSGDLSEWRLTGSFMSWGPGKQDGSYDNRDTRPDYRDKQWLPNGISNSECGADNACAESNRLKKWNPPCLKLWRVGI
jgi:hypothetical protein